MKDIQVGPEALVEVEKNGSLNDDKLFIDPHDSSKLVTYSRVMLPVCIPPQRRLLLGSLEVITIPDLVFGLVTLRSTWARFGLISPPTVADPGFSGQLTFELFNSSSWPILLRPTDKLFKLILVPTIGGEPVYNGRYQGQRGVQPSKALVLED